MAAGVSPSREGKGGKKIPIAASLNGRFIRDSTPDLIVAKIAEWIDILGREGGFMIGIGNVPADTPSLHSYGSQSHPHAGEISDCLGPVRD